MARVAAFIVYLSSPATETTSVAYATVPGTATPPGDYTAMTGTLTFNAGESAKNVIIPVRDEDTSVSEHFTLVLSTPVAAEILYGTGVCTLPAITTPVIPVISIGSITI